MSITLGITLILVSFLCGRVAKTGVHIKPAPWWTNDSLNSMFIVPAIVGMFGFGVAVICAWFANGFWRDANLETIVSSAVAIGAYYAVWRMVGVWAGRVVSGDPAAAAAPSEPPHVPPLKKAA